MKGGRSMKEYSRCYIPTANAEYHEKLKERLEASENRIRDYLDRLIAGTETLPPSEYDGLLAKYHVELQRHEQITHELKAQKDSKGTEGYKERCCRKNRQQREKINN